MAGFEPGLCYVEFGCANCNISEERRLSIAISESYPNCTECGRQMTIERLNVYDQDDSGSGKRKDF